MAPTAPVIMEHHRGREELHADTATLSIGYISHSAGKSDACSAWSATRSDPASMIGGSKDGLLPGGNRDEWRATTNDDMAERGAGRCDMREPDRLRHRRFGDRGPDPR